MEARRREHERHEEREEHEGREPRGAPEIRERRERFEPAERAEYVYEPAMAERSDVVHWGPVWVGFITAFGVLIVLALLAAAVGFSVTPPTAAGVPAGADIAAGIAGIVAVLIAFFAGGWLAGRTSSARGDFVAVALGTTVWALGLVFLVLLTAIGIGGLLGVFSAYIGVFGGAPAPPPGAAIGAAAGPAILALIGVVLTWIATVVGARLGINARAPEVESY